MLNKTVGFICDLDKPFLIDDINKKGLGGSETWVINMIFQFLDKGYHVILFNSNNYSMLYKIKNGLDILPIGYLSQVSKYQYFEHIFICRHVDENILNILQENNNCNNIYFVLHDINLWKGQPTFYINQLDCIFNNQDIQNHPWLKSHLRKIFFMSQWHIDNNLQITDYDPNLIEIIGNGINIPNELDYYDRDNNMLWSSCIERGLDIFIDKIMPKIIEKIPDFKLYIASYNDIPNKLENEHIEYLGSLSKNDLYKEMQKHKVSFLPLNHWETFCITSIENIANGNFFLSPFKYGIRTIFKYFEPIILKDGNYDDEVYCNYIADEIIDKIINYNQYINLQKVLYLYIKDNYSWEYIFNKLYNIISQYEQNNSYYK